MDITQLQYFRTVAHLEHITQAAEELHISQPNLSNAIKRLETSLGVALFERRNGRIFLNDYGKSIWRLSTMPLRFWMPQK